MEHTRQGNARLTGLSSAEIGRAVDDMARYHYLVVDDDVPMSTLITGILHKIGAARVDVAENGEAALAHLTGKKIPDIIISDLRMPQLDGVVLMRHLAAKQFAGGVILVSNSDKRILRMVVNLAEEHNLNVLGALSKPFSPLALRNILMHFDGVKEIPPPPPLPPSLVTPAALRIAIDSNQIVPFFQPKVSIKTGVVVGVEALARWQHPERGMIPPGLFIPVAEEHGLIDLLTQDMLLKTLQQAAAWRKNGLTLTFAINFSALSLADVDLPDRLEAELAKVGIEPSCLTLEVTESCLFEHITSSLETLIRLRLKGIHLSIDDFGSGHSSLEELHRIPFSELKIDRIFVNGVAHDKEARMFLQSAMTLAKKLNLSTVAEGVETQKDWDVCAKLGCNIAQGFLIGRPMSGETFPNWHYNRKAAMARTKSQQHATRPKRKA